MRIGIIGNSHIAAFKLGWEEIKAEHPKIDMTFFGSPSTSMRFFRVEDNCLLPTSDTLRENLSWTSGGYEHIPGGMDAYITVGMGFSFVHLMDLLKNHRPLSEYDPSDDTQQLISESFFHRAMEGTLKNSNALKLIAKIRQISAAPMVYVPNPYGTTDVLNSDRYRHFHSQPIRDRVFDYYKAGLGEMFSEASVRVVELPDDTIANRMFTRSKYSKGSIKLKRGMSSPHNGEDYSHMNAAFGATSLRDVLRHLL
ncbi:hypothetical protein QFZ79_002804 [Arthrobacter sp. V4I6]|uniref:hypothetical protein n=1 Tax=unclassified Arthrobacter TaxID=235627 RepID=UPI002785F59D|nr:MULTISPECIES: hypothetical protein [unclassified Arthrobacter]MDQ0820513.1 hypothetical protein [Arthrobacter sp. V1I7]MDQ0854693.1 hypothetical protein [Arthrobacter sp. V4I6]